MEKNVHTALYYCPERLVSSNVDESLKYFLLFCTLDGYSHLYEVDAKYCLAAYGAFSIPWIWVRISTFWLGTRTTALKEMTSFQNEGHLLPSETELP